MTTAYIQPMFLLIEFFAVIQLVRFWWALHSRGYFGQTTRMFWLALLADTAAVLLFAAQLSLALNGWLGLGEEPAGFWAYLVFGSFLGLVWVNCRGRLEHDSATRTIVALNALNYPASRIHL